MRIYLPLNMGDFLASDRHVRFLGVKTSKSEAFPLCLDISVGGAHGRP